MLAVLRATLSAKCAPSAAAAAARYAAAAAARYSAAAAARYSADAARYAAVAARYAADDDAARYADDAAATAAAAAARYAAAAAARYAARYPDAATAVAAAAAAAAADAFWREIGRDVAEANGGLGLPIWRGEGPPHWWAQAQHDFDRDMVTRGGGWGFWSYWYSAVALADERLDEIERPLDDWLLNAEDYWKKSPDEIMADVARLTGWGPTPEEETPSSTQIASPVSEVVFTPSPGPSQTPDKPPASTVQRSEAPAYDFFLSRSGEDARMGEFVERVLVEGGYSVYSQPSHMPPSADYLEEMNSGLAKSRRLVVVGSPDYWNSPNCAAEWGYFYERDAKFRERSILIMVVRPSSPPPVLGRIVQTELLGLSDTSMRHAILDAVSRATSYAPPKAPRGEIVRALTALASPQPVLSGQRLEIESNAAFDSRAPLKGRDLVQQALIDQTDGLVGLLPANAPGSLRGFLQLFRSHLAKHSDHLNPISLRSFGDAVASDFSSDQFDFVSPGLRTLYDGWHATFLKLMASFTHAEAREQQYADIVVDEAAASGDRLEKPILDLVDVVTDAEYAGLVSAGYREQVEDIAKQAELIAAQVPALPAPPTGDAPERPSVRKRFVLSTLGFLAKTSAVLGTGTAAAVAFLATPQGQAFASVVASVVEMLKAFLV